MSDPNIEQMSNVLNKGIYPQEIEDNLNGGTKLVKIQLEKGDTVELGGVELEYKGGNYEVTEKGEKVLENDINKGKALPEGTIRNWGGKLYKKHRANWDFIGYADKGSKKEKDKKENKSKGKITISDVFSDKELEEIKSITGISDIDKSGGAKEAKEINNKLENLDISKLRKENKEQVLEKRAKYINKSLAFGNDYGIYPKGNDFNHTRFVENINDNPEQAEATNKILEGKEITDKDIKTEKIFNPVMATSLGLKDNINRMRGSDEEERSGRKGEKVRNDMETIHRGSISEIQYKMVPKIKENLDRVN